MFKPIRAGKLLAGNLGISNQAVLENLNPNDKLWITDKKPIDIDSLSILDLEKLINAKKAEIIFKASEELLSLAKSYGIELSIVYKD